MTPELRAVLRTDDMAYLMKCFSHLHPGEPPLEPAWHLRAICYRLREAREGRIRRLAVLAPPRNLKSISAAVALPTFMMGHDPTKKIMIASYSLDLARQHSEKCRQIMESGWYRELFPSTRISERGNRQHELITTAGGGCKAVSVGSSVTGFGADLIILDDCMKAEETGSQAARDALFDWYDGTLISRLNDKKRGVVISIQQRLHEDDLPGYLLNKGYESLVLTAIAEKVEEIPTGPGRVHRREVGDLLNPAREDHEALEMARRDQGPVKFAAQYQQNPVTPEGNLIRMEWFRTYAVPPERNSCFKVIQSWDTASSATPISDYSVCMTWGFWEERWYLLDLYRERVEYPDLKRAVKRLDHLWKPDKILIEHADCGRALAQELRRVDGLHKVVAIRPRLDKQDRLIAQTAELESGKFYLPDTAPWLDALRSELRAFPSGRHDDQVDSLSQFVEFQKLRPGWVATEYAPSGRAYGVRASRARRIAR